MNSRNWIRNCENEVGGALVSPSFEWELIKNPKETKRPTSRILGSSEIIIFDIRHQMLGEAAGHTRKKMVQNLIPFLVPFLV